MAVIRAFRIKKRYVLGFITLSILFFQLYQMVLVKIEEKNITALSYVLANKTIVVDPGHGGRDPGKIGLSGVPEKEINLEVSKRLAAVLGQMGAAIIMTREADVDLSDSSASGWKSKKQQDLTRRTDMANERKADLYISVHCNAYTSPREHGAQVFSQPGSEDSKRLAECVQSEMAALLKNTNRKAKQVDYFALRKTKMPAAIVEIGFITNPKEDELLRDPLYQSKVAWSIAAGIIKYYADLEERENQKIDEKNKEILETFRQQPGQYIPAP
ncbi:cell wall hydrolase/autolysin [Desulforamulus reducens MI-1]|uniref:Cell wall hydrolase/autolysin n=1 Tax=Desulforamulus reducens (strain ATCC BAA-1160 / DSM 100696 / MI-1) TaxID=349161 RepID=A4J161_DESRM|nr:N-acetylmuramoyl-L-alanine amidase [Desulforamulus reducens]ABO48814.1 cell wall hydrolase/autolysin [Desulforamulus reducens MI-1]